MPFKIAALILCLSPITLTAQTLAPEPVVSGYVTSVEPDGTFAVEGWPIRFDPRVVFFVHGNDGTATSTSSFRPFVGEFVDVVGERSKGKSAPRFILATRVTQVLPDLSAVGGTGIIDLAPNANPLLPDRVVRADGRILRIPPTAKIKFDDKLTADSAFATNVWIDYQGIPQSDATILVDKATFRKNTVKAYEEKLHKKDEYDPSAVSQDEHQSEVSKFFRGIDLKKVHPHPDADLQARISRIGENLIPAYQRALAPDDPTRLNYRFQVVDLQGYKEPFSLPNGIILIPFHGLERLKSDSELAAPMAIAIAFALEKETVRGRPARNSLTGARAAGYVAGAVIPGVGIAGDIATGVTQKHLNDLQVEQAGRVALCLMHDAGYDIQLAPIALWLGEPDEAEPIEKIKMPKRSANLYKSLGTTWRPGSLANAN